MSVGARIRAMRGERGWSSTEMAKRAGVSPETISRIENGHSRPTAAVEAKIASALGVGPAAFSGADGDADATQELLATVVRLLPEEKRRRYLDLGVKMVTGEVQDFPLPDDQVPALVGAMPA